MLWSAQVIQKEHPEKPERLVFHADLFAALGSACQGPVFVYLLNVGRDAEQLCRKCLWCLPKRGSGHGDLERHPHVSSGG